MTPTIKAIIQSANHTPLREKHKYLLIGMWITLGLLSPVLIYLVTRV